MNVQKFTLRLFTFLFSAQYCFGERVKTYEAIDRYIANFNQVFATAEKYPQQPGKVLDLENVKSFSQKEKQYLSSLLIVDQKPSTLRLSRLNDTLALYDYSEHRKLLNLNIAAFEEKRTASYNGKDIDLLQFFGDGELEPHTRDLAKMLKEMSARSGQISWQEKAFDFALKVLSFPFQINSALAEPQKIHAPKNSDLAKAIAAGGKCLGQDFVMNPSAFCSGAGSPRGSPDPTPVGASGQMLTKVKNKSGAVQYFDTSGHLVK